MCSSRQCQRKRQSTLLYSHLLCYILLHCTVKTIGSCQEFAFCMPLNFYANMKWMLQLSFHYIQRNGASLRLELYWQIWRGVQVLCYSQHSFLLCVQRAPNIGIYLLILLTSTSQTSFFLYQYNVLFKEGKEHKVKIEKALKHSSRGWRDGLVDGEHWLLFQRIGIQFLGPTWWLKTI